MKLILIEKRPELTDVITFIFQPEQPISWQPGQYLHYKLSHDNADDRGIERWFTISAAPFETNPSITTRFAAESSSFKQHLKELKVGDTIEAGDPEGDFVLSDTDKDYVFIAGGIGITPFRSILAQADQDGKQLKVELLYGNRDEASTVFAKQLAELAAKNPNLKIHNVLEPRRIDAEMIKSLTDYRSKFYYISGPEVMVEAFEKLMSEIGIPEDQQQRDYFPGYDWPAGVAKSS